MLLYIPRKFWIKYINLLKKLIPIEHNLFPQAFTIHISNIYIQVRCNIIPYTFAKYIFVLSFASVGSAKYLFEWRGKVLKGFYRVLEVLEKQRTAMCPFCKKLYLP